MGNTVMTTHVQKVVVLPKNHLVQTIVTPMNVGIQDVTMPEMVMECIVFYMMIKGDKK